MLPDLSPHLHTEDCNRIIQKLYRCREEDFSKFSEPDFDPKDWINQTFKLPEAQRNREQHAQSLVMKLQLFIQEVNKSLEETSQQTVQAMPRILREIESTQQEAVLLQNRMKAVQQDVQKVEQDTASAMDSLLKIDLLKDRMHGVEKALREIDNWSALTTDIDDVFASGNLDLMASRLVALQQSLRVIGKKVPDYKEKNDYLDRLKDQFVSVVSPSVVSALTSQSTEAVQYFSNMFSELDRMADLEQYYQKCLKADLNKSWKELVSSEVSTDLKELLRIFYDKILSTWFSQDTQEFNENVSRLGKCVQHVFAEALQAVDNCQMLTNGLGLPLLIKALQDEPKAQGADQTSEIIDLSSAPKFQEENWDRLATVLNLVKFCGCLLLDLERLDEALLVMFLKAREVTEQSGFWGKFSEEREAEKISGIYGPLESLLMKEKSVFNGLEQLIFRIGEDVSPKFLPDIEKQANRLNNRCLKLATEQIFGPIELLFETVPKLAVGQYLMTFAHHLEPFLSSEDPEMCAALRKGSIPYAKVEKGKPENSEQAVQIWLECAGEGVMVRYAEIASRIRELSQAGAQQLATDIEFLCNVMEDLGLAPSESLAGLRDLLKMDAKLLKSGPDGYPAPLVAAVKEMRRVK